jgi:putative NADH-flavin reductase
MRVFVAGASGAIGRPLVTELIRQGHQVTGITRRASSLEHLTRLGATILEVDVFDAAAVERALRESQAEAVIDEITSLPPLPRNSGMLCPATARSVSKVEAISIAPPRPPESSATSSSRAASS